MHILDISGAVEYSQCRPLPGQSVFLIQYIRVLLSCVFVNRAVVFYTFIFAGGGGGGGFGSIPIPLTLILIGEII